MPYLTTSRPLTAVEIQAEITSIKSRLENLGPNARDYMWSEIYKDLNEMNLTPEDHQAILKAASEGEDDFN